MGGFGLTFYLGTQLATATPTVTVLVAGHDISAGSALTSSDVTAKKYLSSSAPATALQSTGDLTGQAARVDIAAGDPILRSMLGPLSAGVAPVSLLPIPTGYAAVQVGTPPGFSIPPGFITAGSFVDVLVTVNLNVFKPGLTGMASRVVFKSVEVLKVGNGTSQTQANGVTVVTVLIDQCDLPYAAWFGANATMYAAALPLHQGDLPVPDSSCPGLVTDSGVGPSQIDTRYHFTS
jgi:Flp pilus assembly protein CpaB